MKKPHASLCAAVLLVLSVAQYEARAEQTVEFGNYVVQYNALTTDGLSKAVAETYDIKRSRSTMMLNVVVQEKDDAAQPRAVPANVTAKATNLWGQVKDIEMRPVREGNVIYYIGQAKIVDEETLRFDLNIRPENSAVSHDLQFQQQFFVR